MIVSNLIRIRRENNTQTILALCDQELLDKTIGELKITKRFYGDTVKSEEEIMKQVKQAKIINAIGRESVSLLIKNGVIKEEEVIRVEKVPHAQVYTI